MKHVFWFAASPCKNGIDLGIIADVSNGIGRTNLEKMKEALKVLIRRFQPTPEGTRMGLITFARNAELHFTFGNSEFQNPAAAEGKVDEITKLYSHSRTDKGLILANDRLFTQAGGDRPDKPNVLLVLTDGKPRPKRAGFKEFSVTVPPLLVSEFLVEYCIPTKTKKPFLTYSFRKAVH